MSEKKNIYRGLVSVLPPFQEGDDILKLDKVTSGKQVGRTRVRLVSRQYLPTPGNNAAGRTGDNPIASMTVWQEDLFWFAPRCTDEALFYVEGPLSTGRSNNGKEYVNLSATAIALIPVQGRAFFQALTEDDQTEVELPAQPMAESTEQYVDGALSF